MVKEKISSLYHKNKFLLNRSTKTHYSWLFTREFELVRSLDSKRIIIKVKLNIHIVGAWSIVSRFRKSQLKMLSPTTKVLPVWRDLSIFKPNVLHQMQILSYSNLSQRSSIPASFRLYIVLPEMLHQTMLKITLSNEKAFASHWYPGPHFIHTLKY